MSEHDEAVASALHGCSRCRCGSDGYNDDDGNYEDEVPELGDEMKESTP